MVAVCDVQEIENELRQLSAAFKRAELNERNQIDAYVVGCVELARRLLDTRLIRPEDLPADMQKRSKKIDSDESEMLRLVFKHANADPKKASFYFRATRALFAEKAPTDSYSSRINEAGGYQALANSNRRNKTRKKIEQSPAYMAADIESDLAHDGQEQKETGPAYEFRCDGIIDRIAQLKLPCKLWLGVLVYTDGPIIFEASAVRYYRRKRT